MTTGTPATTAIDDVLHGGDQGAWQLAAVALALGGGRDPALVVEARRVLATLGITEPPGQHAGEHAGEHAGDSSGATPQQLAHRAAAPLLQAAALVSGQAAAWAEQSDDALLAQGRASAAGARAFAELALPNLGDLAARLSTPGGRILDVGTGVGALAVAYAEQFPTAEVVGVDVSARALRLAETTVARSSAATRVQLRQVDITDLQDPAGFDLAWVPAPFIPERALRRGLTRVAAVLRPGGWLMLGHGKYGADPVENALNRFKTMAYGGTPLTTAEATSLLNDAGLDIVIHAPTPPGAPAVACARKT